MKVALKQRVAKGGWNHVNDIKVKRPQLVLAFGSVAMIGDKSNFDDLRTEYPDAHIVMCSTAGEIIGNDVVDDSLSLAAIEFEKKGSGIKIVQADIAEAAQSRDVGKTLAAGLPREGLVHAIVFSDGILVNGTALVDGLLSDLPKDVSVTGGLVGDGAAFKKTLIGADAPAVSGKVVLIGLYGEKLRIGYGSLGGWDTFGPVRTITKSEGNVLYEIDRKPALALYKEYLGERAAELPGSGLLFPLSLTLKRADGSQVEVVRTLLGVNEERQSMTFAGDMPTGVNMRLMKANFERLIDGAATAAKVSTSENKGEIPQLALLISCIGRKLVLKERTFEEIMAVRENVGPDTAIIGFYSYGEICPFTSKEKQCQLHNQTMTITTISET